MTVIVEFVGLPGSGKTTLEGELVSALGESGIRVLSPGPARSRRIVRKVSALWHSRRAVLAATRALSRDSRPIGMRARALRWLAATLERHGEAARQDASGAVLVLAEGMAQRALLAFLDHRLLHVNRQVGAYISDIPKPDVIVHLKIDPIVSVQRQQSRRMVEGKLNEQRVADRFDVSPDQLLQAMHSADDLLTHVVNTLATNFDVEVVCLDTSDFDAAEADLRNRIVPLLVRRAL